MEISAIMNIQDLVVNRNVKQREDAHRKIGQEKVLDTMQHVITADMKNKGLIGKAADPVLEPSVSKESANTETSATGNVINMHT